MQNGALEVSPGPTFHDKQHFCCGGTHCWNIKTHSHSLLGYLNMCSFFHNCEGFRDLLVFSSFPQPYLGFGRHVQYVVAKNFVFHQPGLPTVVIWSLNLSAQAGTLCHKSSRAGPLCAEPLLTRSHSSCCKACNVESALNSSSSQRRDT